MSFPLVLLAAGGATRMRGADKLLQEVEGEALVRRQARAGLEAGLEVIVTLPCDRPERDRALRDVPVQRVSVADAQDGMAASIRAGLAHVPRESPGVMICPADMPEIDALAFRAMVAAFVNAPDCVHRGATRDGRLGHPVILPKRLWRALQTLRGDQGARAVIATEDIVAVPLPGDAAVIDLDTPEAWAAWRARRANG